MEMLYHIGLPVYMISPADQKGNVKEQKRTFRTILEGKFIAKPVEEVVDSVELGHKEPVNGIYSFKK